MRLGIARDVSLAPCSVAGFVKLVLQAANLASSCHSDLGIDGCSAK